MNPMLWPTMFIAAVLFWGGCRAEQCMVSQRLRLTFVLAAALSALPGFFFAAYYTKLLGEPLWLYEFRAAPGSELTAAGVGLLAGYLHRLRAKYPALRRQLRRFTVPALLVLILGVPYIKPIIRPLNWGQMQNHWDREVCLQSTPSSCGPASAATLCRLAGKAVEEIDLARESCTYAGGTENWYLAQALRRRGMTVTFLKQDAASDSLPTPAIAGVKLAQGTGHFIALVGREGTNYLVGDPLIGREVMSLAELNSQYRFTGFFLVVK